MEKLVFQDEQGVDTEFYIVEQTRMAGRNYLLVADSEGEEAECLILKDTAADQESESLYEIVEQGEELDALLAVFGELLDDVSLEK